MADFNGLYNPNQSIINQLLRQRDNVENLLSQYSQPQAPVQNIINTGNNLEFEARILEENENAENILINKRTMFLDKANKKVLIKELDGKISEEYEIIIPLDEKDKKIIDLEKRLKEMEVKINESAELIRTGNEQHKSTTNVSRNVKSATKTEIESISKSTK